MLHRQKYTDTIKKGLELVINIKDKENINFICIHEIESSNFAKFFLCFMYLYF